MEKQVIRVLRPPSRRDLTEAAIGGVHIYEARKQAPVGGTIAARTKGFAGASSDDRRCYGLQGWTTWRCPERVPPAQAHR